MGLIASGKSTLAQAFADEFSISYFNTDVVRKKLAGKIPHSRQGSDFNQGIYTPEFSRLTYDALIEHARSELLGNKSVVLDGSYSSTAERQRVAECAKQCKASLYFILCYCDEEETKRRLALRAQDANAVSDGTWGIYQQQKKSFQFPEELSQQNVLVLDTKRSLPDLLHILRDLIS